MSKRNLIFIRLQREALRQSAVNPDTGCVEVNIIATGYSEKHKQFVGVVAEQIRQELEGKRGNFSLGKLFKDMRINDKVGRLILDFFEIYLQFNSFCRYP